MPLLPFACPFKLFSHPCFHSDQYVLPLKPWYNKIIPNKLFSISQPVLILLLPYGMAVPDLNLWIL